MTTKGPEPLTDREICRASGLRSEEFEWVSEAWPRRAILRHIGAVAAGVTAVMVLLAAPNPWWLLLGPVATVVVLMAIGDVAAGIALVLTGAVWCWQLWLVATGEPILILVWLGALAASAGLTWFAAQLWRKWQRRRLGVESLGLLLADVARYNTDVRSFCAGLALARVQGENAAEQAESRAHAQELGLVRSDLLRAVQVDRVMREHRDTLGDLSLPDRKKGTMESVAIEHRAQVARGQLRERLVEAAELQDGVEAARKFSAKG